MHFEPKHIYHLYNRGNKKQRLFFNNNNYLYFLRKVRSKWPEYCDIICYCLMPNHFHFMLYVKPEGCENIILNGKTTNIQNLSKIIGKTMSSYTQAINIQNKTTGNLFQKKTKAKCLTDETPEMNRYTTQDYLSTCFSYIHNNPLESGVVKELKDWPYSSWLDYTGQRNGTLCNKQFAIEQIGLSNLDFSPSNKPIHDAEIVELIF